jgi:type VI secretion system secreted protein VgrG
MSAPDDNLIFSAGQDVMEMTTPLEQTLLVRTLRVTEEISEPYRIVADVYCASPELNFGELLGQKVSIHVGLSAESGRFFHGVASKVSQGATVSSTAKHDVTEYQIEIRPSFWFLTQTRNCRIFPELSTKEILETIFKERQSLGLDFQFDLKPKTSASLPIEYSVQYNESDFAYCSRLMEEVGLAYYFEHTEESHKLVIFDRFCQHKPCASDATAIYSPTLEGDNDDLGTPRITKFDVSYAFHAGKYSTSDFDPEDPGNHKDPGAKLLVSTTLPSESIGCNDGFEIFQYPGEFRDRELHGQEITDHFACAAQQESYGGTATSTCPGFTSGNTFEMTEHPRENFNNEYLITGVEHVITQPVNVVNGVGHQVKYSGKLTCLPYRDSRVPFVPLQKTAKPAIYGIQSATVVSGKSGSSIDVDKLGRILIKFSWDRSPDTTSCRVRLSQTEAGNRWGAMAIPHEGHEVLVSFLDGDPDHPVVVGRVYNAANPPAPNALDNTSRTEIRVHQGVAIQIEGGAAPKLGTL